MERIHTALRENVRTEAGRTPEPNAGIIDSQSVKTDEIGGARGYDAGENGKGRKRHMLVDTLGLALLVVVIAASTPDLAMGPKKKRKQWIEQTCHALKHEPEAARKICKEMKGYLNRKLSQAKRKKVTSAVTYFENNLHRMEYAKHVAKHIPIGSGVTEVACKVIVKERLCRSRMKWKDERASVVLTLRCLDYSDGRWEQVWKKIDRYGFSLAA